VYNLSGRVALVTGATHGIAFATAGAVAFLVSPTSVFVAGHHLVVDGGTRITDGS
jgi:NAD(P)-dependent dehydrogenase (short-subunit alcohol dehydrogenase family)